MDTNVLLEIAGLQFVQKLITERIAQLQPRDRAAAPAPQTNAPAKKPVSKAKLDALAKARAARAVKQTAAGSGGGTVGVQQKTTRKGKRKVTAKKAG